MLRKMTVAVVALVCVSACYRVTVNTGPAPTQTTIDKQWQMSFVYGLVPPPQLNTQAQCPQGVATVVTERSFLNGLVSQLTFGLITPMHAKVTCAASREVPNPIPGL